MIRVKDEPNRHLHVCRENADGKRDTPRTLLRPQFRFDERADNLKPSVGLLTGDWTGRRIMKCVLKGLQ